MRWTLATMKPHIVATTTKGDLTMGIATVTVVEHKRKSALDNWQSRVLNTTNYSDVREGQFEAHTLNTVLDEYGNILHMVEIRVDFCEYAKEW